MEGLPSQGPDFVEFTEAGHLSGCNPRCRCFTEYETPKLVTVRSRSLGLCYYGCTGLILIYILFYTCAYHCKHLASVPVSGVTRLTIQQPTQGGCNPMQPLCNSTFQPVASLPYCKCLHCTAGAAPLARTLDCKYEDGMDLTKQIPVPGTFFAHTRVSRFAQTKECHPKLVADEGCHGTLYKTHEGESFEESYYIADIESFTLLFGSGFTASNPDSGEILRGQSGELDGYVANVGNELGMQPMPDAAEFPSLRKIHQLGDIISVGDLLKLAGWRTLDDQYLVLGSTLRWTGGIIHVHIQYSNRQPWDIWGRATPYYIMTANLLPISEFKKMFSQRLGNATHRYVYDVHGMLVIAEVSGYMSMFSPVELLKVLTTSVALFTVARLVVDQMMLYCHKHSHRLRLLRSQAAHDFDASDHELDQYDEEKFQSFGHHEETGKGLYATNMLRKYADSGQCPSDDDLLHILLSMEKRLNHLDAHDVEVVHGQQDQEPIQKQLKNFLLARRTSLDEETSMNSTGSEG